MDIVTALSLLTLTVIVIISFVIIVQIKIKLGILTRSLQQLEKNIAESERTRNPIFRQPQPSVVPPEKCQLSITAPLTAIPAISVGSAVLDHAPLYTENDYASSATMAKNNGTSAAFAAPVVSNDMLPRFAEPLPAPYNRKLFVCTAVLWIIFAVLFSVAGCLFEMKVISAKMFFSLLTVSGVVAAGAGTFGVKKGSYCKFYTAFAVCGFVITAAAVYICGTAACFPIKPISLLLFVIVLFALAAAWYRNSQSAGTIACLMGLLPTLLAEKEPSMIDWMVVCCAFFYGSSAVLSVHKKWLWSQIVSFFSFYFAFESLGAIHYEAESYLFTAAVILNYLILISPALHRRDVLKTPVVSRIYFSHFILGMVNLLLLSQLNAKIFYFPTSEYLAKMALIALTANLICFKINGKNPQERDFFAVISMVCAFGVMCLLLWGTWYLSALLSLLVMLLTAMAVKMRSGKLAAAVIVLSGAVFFMLPEISANSSADVFLIQSFCGYGIYALCVWLNGKIFSRRYDEKYLLPTVVSKITTTLGITGIVALIAVEIYVILSKICPGYQNAALLVWCAVAAITVWGRR